ncbi:MAG: hypothetical protein ACOVN2_00950, partial [Usitatibacteraceae bacterium]
LVSCVIFVLVYCFVDDLSGAWKHSRTHKPHQRDALSALARLPGHFRAKLHDANLSAASAQAKT